MPSMPTLSQINLMSQSFIKESERIKSSKNKKLKGLLESYQAASSALDNLHDTLKKCMICPKVFREYTSVNKDGLDVFLKKYPDTVSVGEASRMLHVSDGIVLNLLHFTSHLIAIKAKDTKKPTPRYYISTQSIDQLKKILGTLEGDLLLAPFRKILPSRDFECEMIYSSDDKMNTILASNKYHA